MSRSHNERQHLTDNYQRKQINRSGPFKDYRRRPEDTFWWELQGYEIYPKWDWDAPADELTDSRKGYYRNHSPYSCSCHRCRAGWNDCDCIDIKSKKIHQDQDYKDGLAEYFQLK